MERALVPVSRRRYENWSGEVRVDGVRTCEPRTPEDVLAVVDRAWRSGATVRPVGHRHNWSPLTITRDRAAAERVVLVDTTRWLTAMAMVDGEVDGNGAAVRVQTGASMEQLLGFLEAAGHGLASVPAVGEISVGGALAVDAHGTALSCGTLSDALLACTAVVWSPEAGRYVLRSFTRADPELSVLATHLGRAFLTEVTLQVTPLEHLRCRSRTDIDVDTLFAAPHDAGPLSFGSFLERTGRVESILFPFTDAPWLKTWEPSATKPPGSRCVSSPYNYAFSDNLPRSLGRLIGRAVGGRPRRTPAFTRLQRRVVGAGLTSGCSRDLWGPAKDTQLYVKPTTLRLTAWGGVLLVARADVQRAVHELTAQFRFLVDAYRADDRFPVNGPLEIRASGVDRLGALSAAGARDDHPEWDTALWMNVLTFPGTAHAPAFFADVEAWARATFAPYGCYRPEWSKGWAYTAAGPHSAVEALAVDVPAAYPAWDGARAILDELDPHRVFTNPFLDRLLPSGSPMRGMRGGLDRRMVAP